MKEKLPGMVMLIATLFFILINSFVNLLSAQSVDDFRTFQSGNWNSVNTWERWNGSAWINPAPSTPSSSNGAITILNSHTVTVTANVGIDETSVNSGGSVNVNSGITLTVANGTSSNDMDVNGAVTNSGTITISASAILSFNSGSVYTHSQNGGTVPTAVFATGSDCIITGVTSTVVNIPNTCYNVTWNCPSQTGSGNIIPNPGAVVNGNFKISSTGTGAVNIVNGSSRTLDISGNMQLDGGTFNFSIGLGTPTVTVNGNVNINGGNLVLATSTGIPVFNVLGDWNFNSGTFNPSSANVSFSGTAKQSIGGTLSTVFYGINFNNDPSVSGDVTVATDFVVSNQIIMTRGNVDLNGHTVLLGTGTTSATAGALSYTSGFFYGSTGRFMRYQYAASYAIANSRGHFPMGTSAGDYRPLWLAYSSNLSSGGTVSVSHSPTYPSGILAASHSDGSWAGGTILQGVSNSAWTIQTGNGFALNGSSGILSYGGQGFSTFVLSDLNASLLSSVVGTYAAATNSITALEVNRTALTTSEFNNTWRIGSKNTFTSPLPVGLFLFRASMQGASALIEFSTASETSNKCFVIEKSADGFDFADIGTVNGAGNSSSVNNYSFTDFQPYEGINYFRLRQIDFDSTEKYSQIISLENNSAESELVVYPNPVSSELYYRCFSRNGKPVCLELLNEKSQIVLLVEEEQNLSSGKLDISHLSSGFYQLRIIRTDKVVSKKLIISK